VRGLAWAVVVPLKRLDEAKSRLRGALPGVPHPRLVLALAEDTVAAALACGLVAEVTVVSDDPVAAAALRELGARVEVDRPDAGLNAAIVHGAARSVRLGRWVAALTADLPALRPEELAAALSAAAAEEPGAAAVRRFVPDAGGTGTTLLTAPPGAPLDPRFGAGSALAHARSGAIRLSGDWPALRRDVDTARDLREAAALGLGAHTGALVPVYGAAMQGTVASYDPEQRSGTLLLDDGTTLEFGAAAFDASGLRLLRLGQRLRVDRDEHGDVTRVTIPTLG
jgi:2-phospho-L-lactate/phosphoenolpyruvate guanylyltransferase